MKIAVDAFSITSINSAIRQLEDYSKDLDRKANLLVEKLASIGATNVSVLFSGLFYVGPVDISISVERLEENKYAIIANGETVLFAEFGAGVTYGYGHPLAGDFGMGPGTYPGQTHAMTGKGWYVPKSKWANDGNRHTYGNPPTMAMYNTAKDLRGEILRIAQEVFRA